MACRVAAPRIFGDVTIDDADAVSGG